MAISIRSKCSPLVPSRVGIYLQFVACCPIDSWLVPQSIFAIKYPLNTDEGSARPRGFEWDGALMVVLQDVASHQAAGKISEFSYQCRSCIDFHV
jgi:hypothetical protein